MEKRKRVKKGGVISDTTKKNYSIISKITGMSWHESPHLPPPSLPVMFKKSYKVVGTQIILGFKIYFSDSFLVSKT